METPEDLVKCLKLETDYKETHDSFRWKKIVCLSSVVRYLHVCYIIQINMNPVVMVLGSLIKTSQQRCVNVIITFRSNEIKR